MIRGSTMGDALNLVPLFGMILIMFLFLILDSRFWILNSGLPGHRLPLLLCMTADYDA